ncbi:MAG: hypothetical protein ABJ327_01895 [Litoreibacter sp.]
MNAQPVPRKHRPAGDDFLFRPHDLGLLLEIINEDGTSDAVLVAGTFLDVPFHNGSPVLDPERTIEPNPEPEFYAALGCNAPVELKDTPYANQFGSDIT